MDVIERKPRGINAVQPPNQYEVVMQNDTRAIHDLNAAILQDVFNLSVDVARGHVAEAALTGQQSILITSFDIAQTKASKAMEVRDNYAGIAAYIKDVTFIVKPAL